MSFVSQLQSRIKLQLATITNSYFHDLCRLLTLICGGYYVINSALRFGIPRVSHLTVLGYLLPEQVLTSVFLFIIVKCVFLTSALAWSINFTTRLAAWLTTISYLLCISMSIEGQHYTKHQPFVVFAVLVTLLAHLELSNLEVPSFSFCAVKKRLSRGWLYWLPLSWLAIMYTFSGANKLLESGPSWIDGYSLQLFISIIDENPSSYLAHLILENWWVASICQFVAIIMESFAFLIIFSPTFRLFWAVLALCVHFSAPFLFASGFDFYGNITFIILLCLIYGNYPRNLATDKVAFII